MYNNMFDDFDYDTGLPDGCAWDDSMDDEDWKEASGWNDVYGSYVEASDIIEFRD